MRTIPKGETLSVVGVKELHAASWNVIVDEITRQFGWNGTRTIELDLSEATFIDTRGLAALIVLNRAAQKRNGQLRLLNPSQKARRILERTRMDRLIPIESQDPNGPQPTPESESVQPSRSW
ncbi:MAG TPA: STAS domain-containing protein [Verrucomicrobiae bacterium]|nr:STAS domain-containing protein [Verrucomicrobiae bacterium]